MVLEKCCSPLVRPFGIGRGGGLWILRWCLWAMRVPRMGKAVIRFMGVAPSDCGRDADSGELIGK